MRSVHTPLQYVGGVGLCMETWTGAFVIEMYSFIPGLNHMVWSSSQDFSPYNFLWKAHCECWIRKLSEWSVLSVQMDLRASQGVVWCRAGDGLLTHISIMLASISHIWPKFWPIAIKFIKVSDTHSAKITYGSSLATEYFYDWVFKKSFCSIRE